MKIKRILLPLISASLLPIVILSSCANVVSENKPVKLKKSVFETGNKNAFNNIFNLLNNQKGDESFIKKTNEEINKLISDEISTNKLVQEKLKIYFFVSIYNSLNNVVDIIDNNIQTIPPINERAKGLEAFKKIIDDSTIKPEASDSKWSKYESLEDELNKITDMKINLSAKKVDQIQFEWTWETSFKLAEDSKIRQLLKIENGVNNSIFYKRYISDDERNKARLDSYIDGVYNENKYQKNIRQLEYQSSKWYWNEKDQILQTIEKESNLNPYSSNGTSGGFSNDDAKRTKFAIDFVQHPSDITLYKPVFFFQSNKVINATYINTEWENFLKYKKYKVNNDIKPDPDRVKDITIDLKCSYVKYEEKV